MRDRAVFRLAKLVPSDVEGTEAGDIGCIVDAAPDVHRDSQADNSGCLDPTVAAKQLIKQFKKKGRSKPDRILRQAPNRFYRIC